VAHDIGVDIGGTFTDLILLDESAGSIEHAKVPSTPAAPSEGVVNGIEKLLSEHGLSSDDIARVIHGTTVATNAVLERDGVDTGLITTEGFRDVLHIGRQTRPDLYNFHEQRPPPLVRRRDRRTVEEKIGPDGAVEQEISREEVAERVFELVDEGVEVVAVCLLHSYANPRHEAVVEEVLAENAPDRTVVLSSDVLPEYREFERMSTTVINAYVQPIMAEYLERLEERLEELDIDAPFQIMQSNGGIMTAETASEKSAHTLLSGPSAGVMAGQFVGSLADTADMITFDVGGTSADICTIHGGDPERSVENAIGRYPVRLPMLDINTIGAGGGSIAWIDDGRVLRVGPESAGADPGPVCYGQGGERPTVTDAHLLLGRLNPDHLLGGELDVEYDRTRRVVREELAEPLGRDVEAAAEGVLDVAIANMIRGIRVVSVERGYDPREFSLVAFGGAGPLHAHRIIDELDMEEAIIPVTPGVVSSLGLLTADTKHDYVRTVVEPLSAVSTTRLREVYDDLQAEANERLAAENVEDARFIRTADMKYERQGYELTVAVPERTFEEAPEVLREQFGEAHEREYGFAFDEEPVELVNVRLQSVAERPPPSMDALAEGGSLEAARTGYRTAVFDGEQRETAVYERTDLPPGAVVPGPAIVEELSSTTAVGPDQEAAVDDYGNLHLQGAEE
jgi:N-methylhydantoinase A